MTLAEKLKTKKAEETADTQARHEKAIGWLATQGFKPHTYSQPRAWEAKQGIWIVIDIDIPSRNYATFYAISDAHVGKYRCAIPTLHNDTETLEAYAYRTEEEFVKALAKLLGVEE